MILLPDGVDHRGYVKLESGLIVPAFAVEQKRKPIGIDCFAGAGGMGLGFKMAGFNIAAAMEWDECAAVTYIANLSRPGVKIHFATPEDERRLDKYLKKHIYKWDKKNDRPGKGAPQGAMAGTGWISHQPADQEGTQHFFFGDIRKQSGAMVLETLGLKRGEVDCVFGGPPCQGFSVAGKRDVLDPRNSLIFDFARFVIEVQPKTMVMENVPGILSMVTQEGLSVVDAFCKILEEGGFAGFDAIRNSLLSAPGARAVYKGSTGSAKDRRNAGLDLTGSDNEEEDGEQLDLFA